MHYTYTQRCDIHLALPVPKAIIHNGGQGWGVVGFGIGLGRCFFADFGFLLISGGFGLG